MKYARHTVAFGALGALLALSGCLAAGDYYEPNDSRGTATLVSLPFQELDLDIDSSSDQDFFEFSLAETTTVHVLVSFIDDLGDIDIQLLDANGAIIDSEISTTDNEEMTLILDPGTYYLRVHGFTFDRNSYDVLIEPVL